MRTIFGELKVEDKFYEIGKTKEFTKKNPYTECGYGSGKFNAVDNEGFPAWFTALFEVSKKLEIPIEAKIEIEKILKEENEVKIPYTSTFIVGYGGGYFQLRITQFDSETREWEIEYMSMEITDIDSGGGEYTTDRKATLNTLDEVFAVIRHEVCNG